MIFLGISSSRSSLYEWCLVMMIVFLFPIILCFVVSVNFTVSHLRCFYVENFLMGSRIIRVRLWLQIGGVVLFKLRIFYFLKILQGVVAFYYSKPTLQHTVIFRSFFQNSKEPHCQILFFLQFGWIVWNGPKEVQNIILGTAGGLSVIQLKFHCDECSVLIFPPASIFEKCISFRFN